MGSPTNPTVDKFGRGMIDPAYVPAGPNNDVTFLLRGVAPPSPLYIQRDDQLVVEGVTVNVSDALIVNVRQLLAAPQYPGSVNRVGAGADPLHPGSFPIVASQQQFEIPSQNILAINTMPLVEGYLLSVSVSLKSGGATQRGATFCRLWINRGKTQSFAPNAALMLIADYPTSQHSVSWPYGRVLYPTEGPGAMSQLQQVAPAAGADWTFTVALFNRLRLQSLAVVLTTAATVANRIPRLQIKDPAGSLIWQAAPQAVQPASTAIQYSAGGVQVASVVDTTTLNWPLPANTIIEGGSTIGTNTLAIQVGDQYGITKLNGELWVSGQ